MPDALSIPCPHAEPAAADLGSFAAVYHAHYRTIAGAIYRRTGDAHLTEDLTADTFLAAYRAIDRFRPGTIPVRVWLLRIATNKVNRWARRRAGLAQRLRDLARIRPAAAAPAEVPYPTALAALLRLPPQHQAVISLHHLEGLSLDEVALILNCSVAAVKSRLARAREALRREVLAQGDRP